MVINCGQQQQQSTVLLKQQNALPSSKPSGSILNYCLTTSAPGDLKLHSICTRSLPRIAREKENTVIQRDHLCCAALTAPVSPLGSGLSQMLAHRHSVLGRTPSGSAAFTISRRFCAFFVRCVVNIAIREERYCKSLSTPDKF